MIFPDNYVVVERPDGILIEEHSFLPWTDANDEAARRVGGKIIRVNSEPADVMMDYGTVDGRLNELTEHMSEWASVRTAHMDPVAQCVVVTYQDGKKYRIDMKEMGAG